MARQPGYVSNESVQTGPVGVQANEEAFGGGRANGLNALAGGISNAGDIIQRRKEQTEVVWANRTLTQAQDYWTAEIQRRKNSAGEGAEGFTPTLSDDYAKFVEKQLDAAPTGSAQTLLKTHLNQLGSQLTEHAMQFEAQQKVVKLNNDLTKSQNAAEAVLTRTPDALDQMMKQQQETIQLGAKGRLPAEEVNKLMQGASTGFYRVALHTYAANDNPEGGIALLNDKKYDSLLDGDVRAGYLAQFNNMLEANVHKNHAAITDAYLSNRDQIRKYGKEDPNFNLELTSKIYPDAPQQIRMDKTYFKVTQTMQNGSLAAGAEALAASIPEARTGATTSGVADLAIGGSNEPKLSFHQEGELHKDLQEFFIATVKLRNTDPAGAADQTPELNTLRNSLALSQDPKVQHSIQQKIFDARLAWQKTVGIPSWEQSVVSLDDAKILSKSIREADPTNKQNLFMQAIQQYGPHYGELMNAMQKLPDAERISGQYILLGMKADSVEGKRLATALNTKPEVLDASLDTAMKQKLQDTLAKNTTMANLKDALYSGGGQRGALFQDMYDGVEKYAKQLHNELGLSMKDSSERAVDHLLKNEFSFGDSANGRKYIIPLKSPTGQSYDEASVNRIKSRLGKTLDGVVNNQSFATDVYGGLYPGLDVEHYAPRIQEAIHSRSAWVNNGKNDGVTLMADFTGEGNYLEVLDQNHQPIYGNFDKMVNQQWLESSSGAGGSAGDIFDKVMRLTGQIK